MKFFTTGLFLLLSVFALAQKPYFQQEVHYTIAVTLDDRAHTATGNISMVYENHAPEALSEIWMHLWGNAFQTRNTAFARQKLRDADGRYYFSRPEIRGGYSGLDFTVNGQKVALQFDPENPDIAKIQLPKPLASGASITIATPFTLKIPASFSRLGHVGTSYQMTQWYPKPAVYDARGWHAMPYLDQGEFYSEFGSFDVTITLPENYVVGATGALQTASEREFLARKEKDSRAMLAQHNTRPRGKKANDAFPESAKAMKTIRYTAENVHDFAWFADKRFLVLKDTAQLVDGRTVDCWAMFTNSDSSIWRHGAFYVKRSVEFYSNHVGPYPWPHATAVHSALSAGGGMEYPMITVIGNESSAQGLDDVITHEVGHNWFYGILASNERDHPWMDEGLNSYYERRYLMTYYHSDLFAESVPKWMLDPARSGPALENACLMLARNHQDTPPDSYSDDFAPVAYGVQVYGKTALCTTWLEQAVGTNQFDKAMQAYFREWKFKHPYPEDIRESWKRSGLEADWYFQTLQTNKQADPALTHVEKTADGYALTVKNRGSLDAPFPVTILKDGQPVDTQWFEKPGDNLAFKTKGEADAFVVDYGHATLDVNGRNNLRKTHGLFRGFEPLEAKIFAPVQAPGRSTLAVLPWLGWNNYDKTMVGLLIYNPPFPPRRFQYYLAPGIGTASKRLVGLVDLKYRVFPQAALERVTFGLNAKTFDFAYNWSEDKYFRFYRVAPSVKLEWRSGSRSFRHWLLARTLFIGTQRNFDGPIYVGKGFSDYVIHELRYEAREKRWPNPYRWSAGLEFQGPGPGVLGRNNKYLRGTAEWTQMFYYGDRRKVTARLFAGYFLINDRRDRDLLVGTPYAPLSLNPQSFNDYRFDEIYLGRTATDGFFSRQVSQTEGAFKHAFGPEQARLTNSNNFIASFNLRTDLPFRLPLDLPLKPYFDLGYVDDATPVGANRPLNERLLWSGGLLLSFFNNSLEFYFPLASSKALLNLQKERGGYKQWVTWSLRIGSLEPSEVAEGLVR